MEELKIVYPGGYRRVSKYLTKVHSAEFAIIIDAIVYIHNQNKEYLVKVGGKYAVKISNDFLSRHTGLGIDTIKRNVEKIASLGLVTVTTKGQGNTRHYVIHIDDINAYIEALKGRFDEWFDKSRKSSEKDKTRSKEADQRRFNESKANFESAMSSIANSAEPAIGLVQKQPTQSDKTTQPNTAKPTVVKTSKKRELETTTDKKVNVVVSSPSIKIMTGKERREYKTTKVPASEEKSRANWEKLKSAYKALPQIHKQGQFYTKPQDEIDFYTLSEYRQDYVISNVKAKINTTDTASRPYFYIQEAMKDKPREYDDPHFDLRITL